MRAPVIPELVSLARNVACAALALAMLSGRTEAQEPMKDTVVIRVTSPRGAEVGFSGVITLRDSRQERRLENLRTPFELRMPAEDLDARFVAADLGALGAEILKFRGDKQQGHVWGQSYQTGLHPVTLFLVPGKAFGYGKRDQLDQRPLP